MLRSFLWMKFQKIGEIWKELDQTKRMRPTGIFSDHPFRSYSSLKMSCLKRNVKTAAFFGTCDSRFLISWLEQAAIFKRFKIGGSDWAHFLRLFELFPGIINFFRFWLTQKSVKCHQESLTFYFHNWFWFWMFSLSVLRPHFQTALTSKRMIEKGPGWSHSLRLIKIFPDLINFF